jgi:catechol 2,3-dioxygenase-like lactoylglutathione lyase family enzyme
MTNEQFKRMTQVCIVVKDIEKARADWANLLGIKENPIIETEGWEATHATFKGKPTKARAKLTFFHLENIVLEIIEPIGKPSTWQEFLDKTGGGLHHIAFDVVDLDETLKTFSKSGIGVEQKGDHKGGCYTYMDSRGKLGGTIELLYSHRESKP